MSNPSKLRFSGVTVELTGELNSKMPGWKFESRPGGWMIASRTVNGQVERRRFYYSRKKDRFWAKFLRTGANSTPDSHSSDFYGQKIEPKRAGQGNASQNDFTAQFPGKVRKILVEAGAQVDSGTTLMMVEAMKMEFAIKSDQKGTVSKILVQEGQVLTPGQKLLEFTAIPDESKKGAE